MVGFFFWLNGMVHQGRSNWRFYDRTTEGSITGQVLLSSIMGGGASGYSFSCYRGKFYGRRWWRDQYSSKDNHFLSLKREKQKQASW
jgi:hypothetical protein